METLLQKAQRLKIQPAGQVATQVKIPTTTETLAQKAQRLGIKPESKDGFFTTLAKESIKPFAEIGTSAYNVLASTGKLLTGDKEGAAKSIGATRNLPFLGATKPAFTGTETTGEAAKKIGGYGAEVASWAVGGGGAKQVAKQTLKGQVLKGLGTGAKIGAEAGVLAGGGRAAQEGGTVGEIAKGATVGGVGGAVFGGALGATAPLVSKGIKGVGTMLDKEARVANIIKKREQEIFNIENQYSKTRKVMDYSKDANASSRKRIASTDILVNSIDDTGTIRTKQPGGTIEQYKAMVLDPAEGVVRQGLEKEGKSVNLLTIKDQLEKSVMESGLQGKNLTTALSDITKELEGYALKADPQGNIPLTLIHDAKIDTTKSINYFTPPEVKAGRKAIASGLKKLVEDNADFNVKEINSELAKYLKDVQLLENLDGKKVKGGKLGKYFAQVSGNIVGGAAGGAIGGLPGAAVGSVVGGEVAGKIKGSLLSKTFGKMTGQTAPESEILRGAVSANKKPLLGLPSPTSEFRSQIGSNKIIPLPEKTPILQGQVVSLSDLRTSLPIKKTIPKFGVTPKTPNVNKIEIEPSATNKLVKRQIQYLNEMTAAEKENYLNFKKTAANDSAPFADRFNKINEKYNLETYAPQFKSDGRAIEKAIEDYGRDFTKVSDMNRGAFIVENLNDIDKLVRDIEKTFVVKKVNDRFINQTLGYRDFLIKVELPNGTTGEIQIIPKEMAKAKEVTHILYEQSRTLESQSKLRLLTQSEKNKKLSLEIRQKRIYNKAWEKYKDNYEVNKRNLLNIGKEKNVPIEQTFGQVSGKELENVASKIKDGGITYDMINKSPRSNEPLFAVSIYPENSMIINRKNFSTKDVYEFVRKNRKMLDKPNHFLGGWYDTESGKIYLDVSVAVKDKAQAIGFGKEFNQKSIFDLMNLKEINTGGTGESLVGKDILPRIHSAKKL